MAYNSYFTKFPLISYNDKAAIDITRKVKFVQSVRQNPYVFFPYTIHNSERSDQIADRLYEDPYYDWMVYLSNEITDPYFEYYLTEEQFKLFLLKKYGSIENSQEKVISWRNNWEISDDITISAYNALVPERKKYWVPLYREDNKGVILAYTRKRNDWSHRTNRLVKYVISGSHTFKEDEMVTIKNGSTIVGQGEIEYANGTNIILKNVQNDYNFIGTMTSRTTNNSVTIVSSADISGCGINTLELSYYSPFSAYDYEQEKNEYNKTLILLRQDHVYDVNEEITNLLEVNQ
jgi:hypothetical protein